MAGPLRGRGRTASYDSHREANVWHAAPQFSAVRIDFRFVLRDHDFRRQLGQRLEPGEGPRKAYASQTSPGPSASNRHGLEHYRPDLLVYPKKHKSAL